MSGERRLERRLPATLEAVDLLCAELRCGFLAAVPEAERFAVELLLREALTNAVLHGVRGAPDGEVSCSLRLLNGGIELRVVDSGAGFDWHMQGEGPAPSLAESGRGLEILHRYSSSVRFNPKGNG